MSAVPTCPPGVLRWIGAVEDLDGVPATLVRSFATAEARRATLVALVARALALDPGAVEIAYETGRRPKVVRPQGSGLLLSASSRTGWSALAVARAPVGTDVEAWEPGAEIPWLVLHPDERAALLRLDGAARERAFVRLWSLKEAYLKALRIGLTREPSGFAVVLVDAERARIEDPLAPARATAARSAWRRDSAIVVSTVTLGP